MQIIGCDLHARQQTVAMLDTDSGELVEKTLEHDGEELNRLPASLEGSGSSKKSSWSQVIGEMAGGQHRDDEVTRTELVGWTGTTTRELRRSNCRRKKQDCADADVCAKEIQNRTKHA
jgi:hypothetical protein